MLTLLLTTLTAQANPYALPMSARVHPSEALQACNDAFWNRARRQACRTTVRRQHPERSTRIVRSCSTAFWNGADALRCVDTLSTSRTRRVGQVVRACDAGFWSPADKMACIDRAARAASVDVGTMGVCADIHWNRDRTLACMTSAMTFHRRPVGRAHPRRVPVRSSRPLARRPVRVVRY